VAKRFAFRFLAVYFVLYTFPFPFDFLPWVGDTISGWVTSFQRLVGPWVGRHMLGIEEMSTAFTGSGDALFNYVLLLITFVLALLGAAVWTLVDRRGGDHPKARRWLVVGVRFYLGLVMLTYGLVKLVPNQFPVPSFQRLLTPYGDSSPMGLVWTFMGASPLYTMFTGAAESTAGFLLLFRRTRTLGALVAAGAMTNVAALNYLYDVPVKLYSSHLLAMAVALLWLDRERLVAVFWSHRALPAPQTPPPLVENRRLRIAVAVAGVLLAGSFIVHSLYQNVERYHDFGSGREHSSLWGVHVVERYVADGEEVPPLLTDEVRWQALVVDRVKPLQFGERKWPGAISVQHMDGTLTRHPVVLDEEARTLTFLPEGAMSVEEAGDAEMDVLTFEQFGDGRLRLAGSWQGSAVEIEARERPLDDFLLLGRGYHWVNEVPFNR